MAMEVLTYCQTESDLNWWIMGLYLVYYNLVHHSFLGWFKVCAYLLIISHAFWHGVTSFHCLLSLLQVKCLQSEHIFDVVSVQCSDHATDQPDNQVLVSPAQSLMACRALTYMMEALPQSVVIMSDAIPALIDKVMQGNYMRTNGISPLL